MLSIRKYLVFALIIAVFAPVTTFAQSQNQKQADPEKIIQDILNKQNKNKLNKKNRQAKQYSLSDNNFKLDLPKDLQTNLPQMPARVQKPPKKPGLDLSFLAPIMKYTFYTMLAILVAYILYLVLSSLRLAYFSRQPKKQKEEEVIIPSYRPDEKHAQILLEDAEKLASQGKYDEAVHLLLYRSIQDIEKNHPREIKHSLTSREIALLEILSDKAKDSFSIIGKLVENSYFGGRKLDKTDYIKSIEAYKNFAFNKIVS